ncbi:RNA-directed RNA polymerase [Dirofilaria immitis]
MGKALFEMETKDRHIMQGISTDSDAQHEIPQKIQRLITDNMQEGGGSMYQRTACSVAEDAKQMCGTKMAAATAVVEGQAVCSKSSEVDLLNPVDGQVSNIHDNQEARATWQDDEHEYETQMNLLNKEWKRPEVNEIMTKLFKGELPFVEAADRISVILGHEVTVASVRNRALHCSRLPQSNQSKNQNEPKYDWESGENTGEKHSFAAREFGPGLYEVIRNLRGNLNNIAIKEPQSNCVRIYRRSTTRHYYSYYRCSTCDHLSRREVQDAHPSPIIKMVHDKIVGEPFPSHHPDCKPIPLSQLRAMQIDRENRQEVINEMLTPFEAWSRGDLRALLEEARKASQLARQNPQWKKIKCKSRNENEGHFYARPYGETLVSYEEKIRKKLNEQLKRPDSRSSSVASERFGAQTPTDDEWSFARRGQNCRTLMTDESQSLISDLTEAPDADGLLSEERMHIEQSKTAIEDTPQLNRTGKISLSSRDSDEPINDTAGMNQLFSEQIPTTEIGVESGAVVVSTGISKICSDSNRPDLATALTDDTGRDIIRETNRKLFMVDDEHLLMLFQRCPNCGEQLKTLVLSSRKAIPMVTYKCHGNCDEKVWIGFESK